MLEREKNMKIIFATTNKRKVEDLENTIREMNLDIEVLSMEDIGWDRGEIDEYEESIEGNSLLKADAIYAFCQDHNLSYPIITDDAGLFVDALNGEPGVYTGRYADDEFMVNPDLPKHQTVIKLLRNMQGMKNRTAYYRCCVTVMYPNGDYYQEHGESKGSIAKDIIGELKKPYFYAVFVLDGTNVAFNELEVEDLKNTYRYTAMRKALSCLDLNFGKTKRILK